MLRRRSIGKILHRHIIDGENVYIVHGKTSSEGYGNRKTFSEGYGYCRASAGGTDGARCRYTPGRTGGKEGPDRAGRLPAGELGQLLHHDLVDLGNILGSHGFTFLDRFL
jgi:hypothetical protein